MRRRLAWSVAAAAVGFLLAGSLRAQDNYQASDPNVDNIVRYARMAVGGGAVSKLKALEFKGKSKVEMNGFLIDCTVDIKILLPEHYLRVDATPADAKLAGYAGKTVLSAIRSGANLSLPPDNLARKARLSSQPVGRNDDVHGPSGGERTQGSVSRDDDRGRPDDRRSDVRSGAGESRDRQGRFQALIAIE
jgi:hypothetical protein